MRAVEALGRLRDPAAIPALQDALHDPDALVARAAVEALRQLGAGATSPN
jgi:HEAT repeat protein